MLISFQRKVNMKRRNFTETFKLLVAKMKETSIYCLMSFENVKMKINNNFYVQRSIPVLTFCVKI